MSSPPRPKKPLKSSAKHKIAASRHGDAAATSSSSARQSSTPSSTNDAPQALPRHLEGKVAIPRLRLKSDADPSSAAGANDKNRVAHACDPCRVRKTKCSGEQPVCKHCQENGLKCVYLDGKRDRMKKQVGAMSSKLHEFETLLRDLSLNASTSDRDRIERALSGPPPEEEDDEAAPPSPSAEAAVNSNKATSDGPSRPKMAGEGAVTARAGSIENLDKTDEDFNKSAKSQETGYHGKNSEVTWMQRLKNQTFMESDDGQSGRERNQQHAPHDSVLNPISYSTYHLDDLSVFTSSHIDAYALPPKEVADAMFDSFFQNVHPAFPVIGKNTFTQQYAGLTMGGRTPPPTWLAILNMIFAISAKYGHLTKASWRGKEQDDHLIYFNRARVLDSKDEGVLKHPNLQRIQISGLMSFYLMATDQINRAWTMNGVALRYAISIGIHLKNDAKDVNQASKEIRNRVWWSLCIVEKFLAVMTGRAASFTAEDCSTPLPLPVDEAEFFANSNSSEFTERINLIRRWSSLDPRSSVSSSDDDSHLKVNLSRSVSPSGQTISPGRKPDMEPSDALYFFELTRLVLLHSEILRLLYRASAIDKTWAQTLRNIGTVNSLLTKWRSDLTAVFDFANAQNPDTTWKWHRTNLGLVYYSASMLSNRPCLCRVDHGIPNESSEAKATSRSNANACVHAAIDLLKLVPVEADGTVIYQKCSWWNLNHHIMQAISILMLELAFRADHMPTEVDEIYTATKNALNLLQKMGRTDLAALRAWHMCFDMMRHVAPKVGRSFEETMPTTPVAMFDQGLDLHGSSGAPPYDFSRPIGEANIFSAYDQFTTDGVPTSVGDPSDFGSVLPSLEDMGAMGFQDDPTNYFNP